MTSVAAVPGRGTNLDQFRTLVLNANAMPLSTTPLSIVSWREAVEAVYKDRVQVVEEFDGPVIRSPRMSIPVPKVVMAKSYIHVDKRKPALSRLNCAIRDRFRCGYCGGKFRTKDLTFDHVIPRALGGKSTWENLLMACGPCNHAKGSEPANYDGEKGVVRKGNFVPLKRPSAPTFDELYKIGLQFIPEDIRALYSDWLPHAAVPAGTPPGRPNADANRWDETGYWTVELEP